MSDGKKSRTVVPRKVGVWIGGKRARRFFMDDIPTFCTLIGLWAV